MSFNGSGTFNLLFNWQNDAAASLNISSSRMQSQDADIASGLSNCVTRDGQSAALANLPMGGFRLTNVANGVLANDSATLGQVNTAFPVGAIIMWNSTAAAIPANFQLCDGTNGTPNLKDKFIVGAGATYANGTTGGAVSVALSTAQLPAHNHGITDPGHNHAHSDPGHTHVDPGHNHLTSVTNAAMFGVGSINTQAGGSFSVNTSAGALTSTTAVALNAASTGVTNVATTTGITTTNTGTGTAVPTLPPYYALCLVQRMS